MKATQVQAPATPVAIKNCESCGKPTPLPYGRVRNFGVVCSRACDLAYYERHRHDKQGVAHQS